MKIKVQNYIITQKKKAGKTTVCTLRIPFVMEHTEEDVCNSAAVIDMRKLSFFVDRVPEIVSSFLYFSSIIYAIDRSVSRDKYSIDGWSRILDVNIKIPSSTLFKNSKGSLEVLLSYLTGDYWTLSFEETKGPNLIKFSDSSYFDEISQVNLFSGGLDSLIGAIDFMSNNPDKLLFLSSHYDSDMGGPLKDQRKILSAFKSKYLGRYLTLPKYSAVKVNSEVSAETTCRSRSLLFIGIALQTAAYKNVSIDIPENGSVSLNYPLSVSRRSSCSTRTTHPFILYNLQKILEKWGIMVKIHNPYEFATKGEMVKNCANQEFLLSIIDKSNSCGKRARHQFFYDNKTATHCGHCMPCMYRKASLVGFDDRTSYGNTLNTLFGRKDQHVSDDFYAMLNFLRTCITESDIRKELCIAKVHHLPNFERYIDLVRRTREELLSLINSEGNQQLKKYVGLI